MIRKRLVSLFLAVVMLCSLSMTAFAASDEDVAMSAEQGIIASETFEIPVSLSLDELDEMKSELEECGIPYTSCSIIAIGPFLPAGARKALSHCRAQKGAAV